MISYWCRYFGSAQNYYSQRLAALTPRFAGADIANMCNEGALIVVRNEKTEINMSHFEAAIDRVIGEEK